MVLSDALSKPYLSLINLCYFSCAWLPRFLYHPSYLCLSIRVVAWFLSFFNVTEHQRTEAQTLVVVRMQIPSFLFFLYTCSHLQMSSVFVILILKDWRRVWRVTVASFVDVTKSCSFQVLSPLYRNACWDRRLDNPNPSCNSRLACTIRSNKPCSGELFTKPAFSFQILNARYYLQQCQLVTPLQLYFSFRSAFMNGQVCKNLCFIPTWGD